MMGKTARQPASYSEKVKSFLDATDAPILFVGKIVWVNSDLLPCTVANSRTTTWSVSKVLYGFDPGKKIDARFWSCGGVEPQFKGQDEMLVIAYPGSWNGWQGMKESVVPATEANIRVARKALDDYLRRKVRELVRPRRGGPLRPVLVFEGLGFFLPLWFHFFFRSLGSLFFALFFFRVLRIDRAPQRFHINV